jgi:hypothetical protein
MELIAVLISQAPDWLIALSGVVTALTGFTALTPSKLDDEVLGKATKYVNIALKFANMGAGNVGQNKNKDDD